MKTGTPTSKADRKTITRTGIGLLSIDRKLVHVIVSLLPALARMGPNRDGLPDQHQETAEGHTSVDKAHRQVEHRHGLRLHAADDRDREIREQPHETERDKIH